MHATELSPVDRVQNPAFGAQLLWTFGRGYQDERPGELPSLLLLFLILPLLFHTPTLLEIRSTNLPSGLAKFAAKLAQHRERLLAVHLRAREYRQLTLDSLSAGISAGLLRVDYDTSNVRSNEVHVPSPPERLKFHLSSADKLGRWFARMPANQVFALLQVEP